MGSIVRPYRENVIWQDSKPEKGGRGGKHGRVEIGSGSESDRLLLHFPMCMKYPDHENCVHEDWCEKTFTERSGSITIDTNQYTDKVSCLWQFNMPASHTLEFQFVGDFDLEYHYKCGYDRVHIFSGKISSKITDFFQKWRISINITFEF